jgi:hypothetical protein
VEALRRDINSLFIATDATGGEYGYLNDYEINQVPTFQTGTPFAFWVKSALIVSFDVPSPKGLNAAFGILLNSINFVN